MNVACDETGSKLSEDYSRHIATAQPQDEDVSQHFEDPLSISWSCENEACNCSEAEKASGESQWLCGTSSTSIANTCTSTEGLPYMNYPYTSSTNTEAMIAEQIKEGICPLATGASSECVPERCGASAPCKALWMPDIEECGEVPCITDHDDYSPQSLRQTTSSSPSRTTRGTSNEGTSPKLRKLNSGSPKSASEREYANELPSHNKKSSQTKQNNAKQAHSLVEKRYRENLNTKIVELQKALSSSFDAPPSPESSQVKKSEVLQIAIDYVNQSQLEMRHMTDDVNRLNARVKQLEKLVKCEDCGLSNVLDDLRVVQPASGMNGIGASFGMAATSAV